jgi:hypothetical protein
MTNQTNNNQFRDDEIAIMSYWDKKEERWVKSIYQKMGGRLRLAHDQNDLITLVGSSATPSSRRRALLKSFHHGHLPPPSSQCVSGSPQKSESIHICKAL